jgi:hypothetical protein
MRTVRIFRLSARRLTLAAAITVTGAAVFAASAGGLSYEMAGKWKTETDVGSPTLKLKHPFDPGDHVFGTYKDSGGVEGVIDGELFRHSGSGDKAGKTIWKGGFSGNDGSGKFKVQVHGAGDTFEGWYRVYNYDGDDGYGPREDWQGKHVD